MKSDRNFRQNPDCQSYLKIENASGNLNGYHTLEDVRSNRFTLDEYLAFGMPKTTTWYKK